MQSVLNLQGLHTNATTAVAARSTLSVYRCGKDGHSTISVAWCIRMPMPEEPILF